MSNLTNAVERIKALECPTGDVENRIAGILEEYEVAGKSEIKISRDERFDDRGAQAYTARISGDRRSVVVLAESGLDDYVAKVVDVYIS